MKITGLKIGHVDNREWGTGVTVFIPDEPCTCALHVHGFAPGTRQVDSLSPDHIVDRVDAVLFCGGSAYGLDAASGAMEYFREMGRGMVFGNFTVPIVPTAVIFDLFFKEPHPPTPEMVKKACQIADYEVECGSVGVGCGATVGKVLTVRYGTKGGFGAAQHRIGDAEINVFIVLNAFGDILHPETGSVIAGARKPDDESQFLNTEKFLCEGGKPYVYPGENTTLVLIHVHGSMDRENLRRVAVAGGAALARFISPSPSMFDGDAVFAISTGTVPVDATAAASVVRRLVPAAGISAVQSADGMGFLPAWSDLKQFQRSG